MPHLIVALATSPSQGCQQAMKNLALPQLDRLLARLSPAGLDAGNETDFSPPHERALARHLGLAAGPAGTTPWAAWHRLQTPAHMPTDHGLAWAFITPCQWQADANHVLLADPAQLQLTEDDSRSLLAILAPWFAEDGITLVYDQPTRWLAHGAAFDGLATASLDRVLQRDVSSWLPDKLQARNLHRLHRTPGNISRAGNCSFGRWLNVSVPSVSGLSLTSNCRPAVISTPSKPSFLKAAARCCWMALPFSKAHPTPKPRRRCMSL